jgi:hypothetical protein
MMGSAPAAKSAKFAGERHQMFKSATVAFYAKKTMLEHSASKVLAEFIVDERW